MLHALTHVVLTSFRKLVIDLKEKKDIGVQDRLYIICENPFLPEAFRSALARVLFDHQVWLAFIPLFSCSVICRGFSHL